jgi:hypothetical protein
MGELNSLQYCSWADTGKMRSWEDAEESAIETCNAKRPQGGATCEVYAHNNVVIYVNPHEQSKIAMKKFEAGDIPATEQILNEISYRNLSRLTPKEIGEYEYLRGKIIVISNQVQDRSKAIDLFDHSWYVYKNVNSAVEEGNLRMLAGEMDKNWRYIRPAYQFFLANASDEQKTLHPEVEQNLKQTEQYFQADLVQKEKTAREQAALDAIREKEQKEQAKSAAIKAKHDAQQQEKVRLAEAKRQAIEGDGSADDSTCKSYGAKPGSVGYINCRVQLNRTKQLADEQQAALRSKEASAQKEQLLAEFNSNKKCASETFNPACMTNAGYALYKYGNKEDAKGWFTLAARYGEPTAIKNLTSNGWPVPAADLLAQQQQTTDNNSGTNALMLLLTGVNAYQQGKAAGYQSNPPPVYIPPPQQINCTSTGYGNVVHTNCR